MSRCPQELPKRRLKQLLGQFDHEHDVHERYLALLGLFLAITLRKTGVKEHSVAIEGQRVVMFGRRAIGSFRSLCWIQSELLQRSRVA